jgi:hypothetical protein
MYAIKRSDGRFLTSRANRGAGPSWTIFPGEHEPYTDKNLTPITIKNKMLGCIYNNYTLKVVELTPEEQELLVFLKVKTSF